MINLKNNLLRMGRNILHQRESLATDCGMSYSLGPAPHDPDLRPTLFFYWHEPLADPPADIPMKETRGSLNWLSRLGLARKSA